MTSSVDGLRKRIKQALNSQKQETITVLSCLLSVEDDVGYIPEEAVNIISKFMDVTENDVWGVASFYTNFQFHPPGRHIIEACWGPSCHILGAGTVVEQILGDLGLSSEGSTSDGECTLRFNTCLGACANGPIITVDHKVLGKITPKRASELIAELVPPISCGIRNDE